MPYSAALFKHNALKFCLNSVNRLKFSAVLIKKAGFHKFSFYQTLFDLPEKITCIENPLKGYGLGGFVVISAVKKYKSEI